MIALRKIFFGGDESDKPPESVMEILEQVVSSEDYAALLAMSKDPERQADFAKELYDIADNSEHPDMTEDRRAILRGAAINMGGRPLDLSEPV